MALAQVSQITSAWEMMLTFAATSGGTESILMSVKTHRDWARVTKGITRPEMYAASSFAKKCQLMNVSGSSRRQPTQHSGKHQNTSTSNFMSSQLTKKQGKLKLQL